MWFLTGSAYSAFPYETLLILIYDNPIYKAVFCCFTPFYGGLLHPLTDAAHYAMTYLQKPTSRWEHLSHPKLSPVSVSLHKKNELCAPPPNRAALKRKKNNTSSWGCHILPKKKQQHFICSLRFTCVYPVFVSQRMMSVLSHFRETVGAFTVTPF